MIEDARVIRLTELSYDQYCVPNPTHRDGLEIPAEDRSFIDDANKAEILRMKVILAQPRRQVDEWIVFCNGTILYMTEGRTLNFVLNLYRFALTIGMLVATNESMFWLMLTSVLILLPNCILSALKFNVMLGRAMNITDVDLYHALGCIGLGWLIKLLYKVTGAEWNRPEVDKPEFSTVKAPIELRNLHPTGSRVEGTSVGRSI